MPAFVKPNNTILSKVANKIPLEEINSDNTKKIIGEMLKTAYGEQKDITKPVLVGLAAPQIGFSKRIILIDTKADGKGGVGNLKVYINPEIIWKSKEEGEWYEGCFSTGNVCGIVSRPNSIKTKSFVLTPQGWTFELVIERHAGYTARIFQHEIDHLNGIRFPDLIKDPDKLHWVEKDEFPLYRQSLKFSPGSNYRDKQAWKNWAKKCSFDMWAKIKGD